VVDDRWRSRRTRRRSTEDRWHDSDESVRVDVLLKGAATLALFWPALAAQRSG
jgi:acetylornithine deacetylase/succinyl-diaminopimelate desuccinylase-like protein